MKIDRTANKVSVVIPVYNSVDYLVEAVKSVIRQTFVDWELLVIDDGSTEDVAGALLALGDDRVRVLKQKRSGNYFARNHGIAEAKGEFIAFLDADDLWVEDKLRKQIEIFESDRSVGACFTDHYVFEDGAPEKRFIDTINTYSDDGRDQVRFVRRLLRGNFLITSSAVIRRTCFDKLHEFDTTYQNAMDYDLWLRIIMNHRVRYLADRLILRRIHPSNISRNRVNTMAADKYTFEKLLSDRKNHALFIPEYEPLIIKRIQELFYYLGLEHLVAGDFDKAIKSLEACRLRERRIPRQLALWTAHTRSKLFLKLIQKYRLYKQRSKVRPER